MAIVFYKPGADDKVDAFYAYYTGGRAWNEDDPKYPASNNFVSSLKTARTEEGMKEILTCLASKWVLMDKKVEMQGGGDTVNEAVSLVAAFTRDDLKVYVLKGIHQEKDPHITLAMFGDLLHLNVKSGRKGQADLFTIVSISVGKMTRDDPEWKKV